MQVIDEHHDRALRGECLEEPSSAPHQLRDRELGGAQVHRRGNALHDRPRVRLRAGTGPRGGRSCGPRSCGLSSGVIPAASRTTSPSGQNVIPSPYGRHRPRTSRACSPGAGRELADQPGLADAGVADHGDELGLAARRSQPTGPRLSRPISVVATDERRAGARHARLSPSMRHEPIRGHGLGLALEVERGHELDFDLVSREPVRQVAEDDLAAPRGLLQPGGRVHRIAGDHPLRRDGVAGDDLAAVDPDVVAELEAERPSGSLGSARPAPSACRRLRGSRGLHRPRAGPGRPNTAITASPMNFSTVPPCRSSAARMPSKYRDMTSRMVSGLGASPLERVDLGHREHDRHRPPALPRDDRRQRSTAGVQYRIVSRDWSPQLGQIRIPGSASGTAASVSPERSAPKRGGMHSAARLNLWGSPAGRLRIRPHRRRPARGSIRGPGPPARASSAP